MPRYIVRESIACWVTYSRIVEAPNEQMAEEAIKHPESAHSGCQEIVGEEIEIIEAADDMSDEEAAALDNQIAIGETIDGYEQIYEVEEVKTAGLVLGR